MGDKSPLAKARRDLEELYLGVPDDSVNLTFQDLPQVMTSPQHTTNPKLHQTSSSSSSSHHLSKLPSIDFSRSIEAASRHNNHLHGHHGDHHHGHGHGYGHHGTRHADHQFRHGGGMESSMVFSDVSQMSGMSMASMHHQRGGRRRPGIPHSNICTVCSTYIYIFRNRCLVCGRVYCKQCLKIGMGEMKEGRKCIECLGKRFSQRYIQKAGQVGCCMGYPSTVKQQELKWAERGPRKSGENRYGQSSMMPRSQSPVTPRTPTGAHSAGNTPSFVINSPYSHYSPTSYPLPL